MLEQKHMQLNTREHDVETATNVTKIITEIFNSGIQMHQRYLLCLTYGEV